MSVFLLVITTAILMLLVPTLLVASPVPVTRDTLEMESHAWVSCDNLLCTLNCKYVLLLVTMTVNTACTVVEGVNFVWSGRGCALA